MRLYNSKYNVTFCTKKKKLIYFLLGWLNTQKLSIS